MADPLANTNRYAELIKAIVSGNFYASRGSIVPYRLGNTEVRLETNYPNSNFGLYINEVFSGSVVSDAEGNVVFARHFDYGDNELLLIHQNTARRTSSWITVREYALWLISYATVFDSIDADWLEAYRDMFIETATINGIEDVFGRAIQTYRNLGQDLDTYRRMLHELRLAYRQHGGKYEGLDKAVSEFTQVPPFGYARRMWGPNWVLDQSMLINDRYKERSHTVAYAGAGISGVQLERVEADLPSGSPAAVIEYDPTPDALRWQVGGSWGPYVPANNGALFLPGPPSTVPAFILGLAGPFLLSAFEDKLYLDIDDVGIVVVTLTTGFPTPTVANVIADINAALGAVVASSYNGKLLLQSTTVAGSSVKIESGPSNAAAELFGIKPGDLKFDENIFDGVFGVEILGVKDIHSNCEFQYRYDGSTVPPTREIRWHSGGALFSPWTPITEDIAEYVVSDSVSATIKVKCYPDEMAAPPGPYPTIAAARSFKVAYTNVNRNLEQTKGAWVLVDRTQLPAILTSDNVDVVDDATFGNPELPDNWWLFSPLPSTVSTILPSKVVTDKLESYDPSPQFLIQLQDLSASSHALISRVLQWPMPRPGPRGTNFPQQSPGLFYDYEGYLATFSGWILSGTAGPTTASLSFSFDGGATWVAGPAVPVQQDSGGSWYEDFTFLDFSVVIPADLVDNSVLVAIEITDAGSVDVMIDSFNVDVEYITSRVLANTTIARYRHRQYFGELLWCWSPDPLSLTEQEYIGLPHKRATPPTVLSGVEVTSISLDTNPGNGTFEYEYNSVGDLRRLRWTPNGTTWTPGVGWVSVTSSGYYQLLAPDSSSIQVLADYDLLPILSGTPPAATESRIVEISDTSVQQGHVRKISPAHSSIDIFDVTEYGTAGEPLNLKGPITEADFSNCTLVNMDVNPDTPFRYSFVGPNVLPIEGEELTFSGSAPYVAALLYDSDQDQEAAMLFEDGVLVPNDKWHFNSASQIQVDTAYYNSSAQYTFNYNPIYRITTPFIDLGTNFQDYMWLVDYMLWERFDHNEISKEITVPIYINPDTGRAILENRSNRDQSTSTLFLEDEDETRIISPANWRYIDSKTVELDVSQYVEGVLYQLTYESVVLYDQRRINLTFEHRSGPTSTACGSASWNVVEKNENVNVTQTPLGHVIHQLRFSASNIRDLRDFRLRSMVMKGLHLFGSNANVPGLTNV